MHADHVALTQLHKMLMATTTPMAHHATAYLMETNLTNGT